MRAALGFRAPLLALGLAAVAIGVSGCGTSTGTNNDAVTVTGSTLTIWAAQPSDDSGGQVASDVLDGEKLAFSQAGAAKIDGYTLRLQFAHDNEVSADARQAISDKTAIAYLGEIEPGTSGVSTQITNEVGLLQVSPTDTAAYLTQGVPGVKNSPKTFFPAHSDFKATFGRVVPNTIAEAKALVARMKTETVTRLDVADDGTPYGITVAGEVRSAATAAGITVVSRAAGADGVLYAGLPGTAATKALDAAAAAAPSAKLFAPSALYDDTFVSHLSTAAQKALTVSAPGFLPGGLDPAGQSFVSSFRSRYGHAPAPQAIFGYAAMRAVIATLQQAGDHASSRDVVVNDFRDLTQSASQSVLGAYRISGGDTNIAPFVFAGVSRGMLVPRAAG